MGNQRFSTRLFQQIGFISKILSNNGTLFTLTLYSQHVSNKTQYPIQQLLINNSQKWGFNRNFPEKTDKKLILLQRGWIGKDY